MRGILIFDHLNDALFTKCDKRFAEHVHALAKIQGLINENEESNESEPRPSPNIVMQLFSPLITSQHVMASQFGNSYTSIRCQDGLNLVFDEFMGYTFVHMSKDNVESMKRTLGVCVSIVRHVCGPDLASLKTSRQKVLLVSSLLDAWRHLRDNEQSMLTEAVEQLSVNVDLASSILKVLNDACDKLKTQVEFANVHVLVLVENKFLSLYSSKNAQDLSASDILLMILLCWVANGKESRDSEKDNGDILLCQNNPSAKDEVVEPFTSSTKLSNPTSEDITNLFGDSREPSISEGLCTYADSGLYSQLALLGSEKGYTANAIHITELAEGINLVTIVEVTNLATSSGLYESLYHLNVINALQLERDIDELRPAFENFDNAIKKAVEGIRKNRANVSNDVDMCQRRLRVKWEFLRKKYIDLMKSRDPEAILQIEANTSEFMEIMKELFRLTCFEKHFLKQGTDMVAAVSRLVRQKMNDFSDFLKVKALKNFTLESTTSLTINKYLEEFPGLVHFIYIDRTTHRLTAPTLDFANPETLSLAKKKIWNMVEQSRKHLQEGHLAVTWKDTTFHYAYFLWFEDCWGSPLTCKLNLSHAMKNFPVPGVLCGDYYRKLAELLFPKLSTNEINIYELFCVHLGLTTSSCVLEHSRRLTATMWEVTGVPNNPADIL